MRKSFSITVLALFPETACRLLQIMGDARAGRKNLQGHPLCFVFREHFWNSSLWRSRRSLLLTINLAPRETNDTHKEKGTAPNQSGIPDIWGGSSPAPLIAALSEKGSPKKREREFRSVTFPSPPFMRQTTSENGIALASKNADFQQSVFLTHKKNIAK